MNRTKLIYLAASLAFATCILHLIGTLMPIPAEQMEVIQTAETMTSTLVPMPIGAAKSYMQILNGNNFGTALLLLIIASQLVAVAQAGSTPVANRIVHIAGFGLAGFTAISLLYFFPIPAIFTGMATICCFAASRKARSVNVAFS